MKGLQPAINDIQSLKERKGHSNKWRRNSMLYKVKERARQNLTTGWKALKISSALLLLLKKTVEKNPQHKYLQWRSAEGKSTIHWLTLTSSNPAPNLRKPNTIAPVSHYFVTGWGPLHIFPHHFLLSQCKKAGDGSAIADSPPPAPACGNGRRLFLLLSS